MNQYERLKENRREYGSRFALGFMGGKGLLSVLILALFSFLGLKQKDDRSKSNTKDAKGPEQFDIIE